MRRILSCALLAALAIVVAAPTTAQEKKGVPLDEKAFIEAVMKAGTPGENHKKLDPIVGSWTFTIKMWMDPSKEPTESKGTCANKWIFDGRYIEETIKGDFGGMEFIGRGVIGYDNTQKKYVSTWIDSMSTGIMMTTGTASTDGKTFTFGGDEICPATEEKLKVRMVMKIISKDKHESEYYQTRAGKESKTMHIVYSRVK
jgi:hypothetical protein